MPESLTAPASSGTAGAPVTPAPAAAPAAPEAPKASGNPIADAGAAFKSAQSWEDVGLPAVAGMDVTASDEPTPEAVPEGEQPAGDAPEFSQDADGKWHRADGTFATTDEIAAIEAQLASEPAATEPAKPETDEPKADNIVTLRTRNGTTREVVIDDPELAQEIRQNMNDGMRRREYNERSAALEARESELQEFQTMLRENPEGIWRELPEAVQIRILTRGIAQHFDALVPVIQGYDQNPQTRITAVTEAERAAREQGDKVERAMAATQQAREVKTAVAALIPEDLPEETAREFWDFASIQLSRLIDQGQAVTKDTVKGQLASLTARFGFGTPSAAPAAPARPRIAAVPAIPAAAPTPTTQTPAAVPANATAKELAEKAQRRIKLSQRNRANAAAVPPAGAGAAPVRLPPVPAGASIEEASRALKTQRSWTS